MTQCLNDFQIKFENLNRWISTNSEACAFSVGPFRKPTLLGLHPQPFKTPEPYVPAFYPLLGDTKVEGFIGFAKNNQLKF